jgi:hypothetical protein
VSQDLKTLDIEQVLDIRSAAGEEVVEADDVVALCQEPFADVGADETGAAGDEDAQGAPLGNQQH